MEEKDQDYYEIMKEHKVKLFSLSQVRKFRLKKITLENFKSVKHGEIVLSQDKLSNFENNKSNILGIYGQNGSGKSALIQALRLIKDIFSCKKLDDDYAKLIDVNANSSKISCIFQYQVKFKKDDKENGFDEIEFEYSFSLDRIKKSPEEILEEKEKELKELNSELTDEKNNSIEIYEFKVGISHEKFKIIERKSHENDLICTNQVFCDTSYEDVPFGPKTRYYKYFGKGIDKKTELTELKNKLYQESRSFVFSLLICKYLDEQNVNYGEYSFLFYISYIFNITNFFVIDRNFSGAILSDSFLLFNTVYERKLFSLMKENLLTYNQFDYYSKCINGLSVVLNKVVPGFNLELKVLSKIQKENKEEEYKVLLVAKRGDVELPLYAESDGVRKIVAILGLFVSAFNSGIILVVDEFDEGIFEYLLGELLEIFQDEGVGQLIFTAHNLRPLEVLNKDSIVFTTSNPENRYYRFKHLSSKRTLRESYFREIVLHEQDEELYRNTKKFKIEAALDQIISLSKSCEN